MWVRVRRSDGLSSRPPESLPVQACVVSCGAASAFQEAWQLQSFAVFCSKDGIWASQVVE